MSNIIPSAFLRSLIEDFNIEKEDFLAIHHQSEPITSIRLNPFKPSRKFEQTEVIPWCQNGRYLEKRPSFIADPLFHAGCYYVQEASSMFLEQALSQSADLSKPLRVLDLCASPGGKSTHLASLISQDSLLVSNEIIKGRVLTLADNLTKWGNENVIVTNNDPKDFDRLAGYFDVVVVDAPCSGSGMWRKDPQTIEQWSEAAVDMCSQRQQRILADVYPALKEGGILIYSTCSYSKQENEVIADWLAGEMNMNSVRINLSPEWNIQETESDKHSCFGYRFYPNKLKGEGFFIACFKKKEASPQLRHLKYRPDKPDLKHLDIIKKWLKPTNQNFIFPVGDDYGSMLETHEKDLALIQSKLYLKKSGIRIGKIAGKDLIPDHELALSLILNSEVKRINLNYEQAIKYLRKDDLSLSTSVTGWVLICFEGFALGWAKLLPNRLNNYYPKELRILKEIN